MASFTPKDSAYEGRQFTLSSKTSITKWLGLDIVKSGDMTWEIRFPDSLDVVSEVQVGEWILQDKVNGVVEVYTDQELQEKFFSVKVHQDVEVVTPAVNHASVGKEEIEKRFGFHKATIEGKNATAPKHSMVREMFKEFAGRLDSVLPQGRYKSLVMTDLENASMWSHKSIAERSN